MTTAQQPKPSLIKNLRVELGWQMHALSDFVGCNCKFLGRWRWRLSIYIDLVGGWLILGRYPRASKAEPSAPQNTTNYDANFLRDDLPF